MTKFSQFSVTAILSLFVILFVKFYESLWTLLILKSDKTLFFNFEDENFKHHVINVLIAVMH